MSREARTDPSEVEVVLVGGDVTTVVRKGDTVRRSAGFWTPAVHALLRHLEQNGFDGAPRSLGVDEEEREVLSFIPGDVPSLPLAAWVGTDDVLTSVANLLRRYHAAAATFEPPPTAEWQYWVGAPRMGGIVCHHDLTPLNVVFRNRRAAAMIDWDFAAPAPHLFDVAETAKQWVPLKADARARQEGYPDRERGPRLRAFSDAYGLTRAERQQLVDVVRERCPIGYESHRMWAAAGRPGFVRMWNAGSGERILADIAWLDTMRTELLRHLR